MINIYSTFGAIEVFPAMLQFEIEVNYRDKYVWMWAVSGSKNISDSIINILDPL
jgi:hypothetical protein